MCVSFGTLSGHEAIFLKLVSSQTLLVSTWVSKYSWRASTHCSVPTSRNTIESTSDSEYLRISPSLVGTYYPSCTAFLSVVHHKILHGCSQLGMFVFVLMCCLKIPTVFIVYFG